jgi:endonuclease/exonuclease/phosphatase family metal-dependent hydrolase
MTTKVLSALALTCFVAVAQDTKPAPGEDLRVMTYNLRYASASSPNAWADRRPLMRELLQQAAPDIIGTQEGLYQQLKDIAADLPGYDWIGVGRDDGKQKGEFMAVFYRQDRLRPMETNYFWLSDTPEVPGSTTWGNKNRRMVTRIKFLDLKTRREFQLLDTHFDHEVQLAREKSAQLVRKRVEELPAGLPLLLLGDFNAAAGSNRAYHLLTDDGFFRDTWPLAKARVNEGSGTFNGFRAIPQNGQRIDWILLRGKAVIEREEILTFSRDGRFPSDHCPVMAVLHWE